MLQDQLTDVGLRQVARHRQAHGGRECLGTNMTSRGTSDTTHLGRSPLGPPAEQAEHALISPLTLNGLRVSEATGTDIEQLGRERGHRTLTITRKGGKIVTIPLAPRTTRAIDLAIGERTDGPVFLARTGSGWTGTVPGGSSAASRAAPGSARPSRSRRTARNDRNAASRNT
jgi:integrase